jgi:hypothetical protein
MKTMKITAVVVTTALSACAASSSTSQHDITPIPIAQNGPCCGPVTNEGHQLLRALNSLDVEHHWPANREVQWDTGEPIGSPVSPVFDPDTHCSLFTAAVGKSVGVYMPRPPRYSQNHLSGAQLAYFDSRSGRGAGWFTVTSPEQAQALANRGYLVVFGYFRPKSIVEPAAGHVAIVRPSETRTAAQIRESGVLATQAGTHNHAAISARRAFRASELPTLRYFAHKIDVDYLERPADYWIGG